MLVYVRPSNEALPRAHVPGAQGQRGCPSYPFYRGGFASKKDGCLLPRVPLRLPVLSQKGVAKAALNCAHRTTVIHLIDPSKLARSLFRDGG
jgi:hypothetical protein